ncbi:uncharacterized protein EHS24_005620 [Apiotrichum porosum]|uniref:Uncharacterized protein n=1 Tax=Apiotrichum porosum TaxID=105984 RepID=A0A427XZ45_9TREE|nr:uncharacterized protein EHS24_005620 [Apiotrichum porosum]RSH84119.1 hypothetical protein EHS24_005620 [Apiotrichum porosum]
MEGWPPGAFHRYRFCIVNEGNFCKAEVVAMPAPVTQTQPQAQPESPAVRHCCWCRIPLP